MDNSNNSYGKDLLDFCIGSGMRILNGRTNGDIMGRITCQKYNGCSTVDYGLVHQDIIESILTFNVVDSQLSGNSLCPLVSDHYPISMSMSTTMRPPAISITPVLPIKNRFQWKGEASTELFRAQINRPESKAVFNKLLTKMNFENVGIDETIDDLTNAIMKSASNCLKRKHRHCSKIKKGSKKWYNNKCVALQKECQSLSAKLRKSPFDQQLRIKVFSKIKEYKTTCRQLKRNFKNRLLSQMDELYDKDPSKYWKVVNDLKNTAKSKNEELISPQNWFEHYRSLLGSQNNDSSDFDKSIQENIKQLETEQYFSELDFKITENDIRHHIKKLKKNKSPGLDGISNEMIKAGSNVLTPILVKVFNKLLNEGKFPKSWGQGLISSIHKESDMADPQNYRGITLCSCLAKLFTSILNDRLYKFIYEKGIMPKEQIGFKRHSRTSDHIFTLKTIIDKFIKKSGGHLYACFVDFSKAFDTVWWPGLFYKLLKLGIRGNFYSVIKSMYDNVQCSVKINGEMTDSFPVFQGVRQGEILSPLLFNIFIHDLPTDIAQDSPDDSIRLNNISLDCLMYADDIVLLAKDAAGMQSLLDRLGNFCLKWKLKVNLNKTKIMVFKRRNTMRETRYFKLLNNVIDQTDKYKYLGIYITENGEFDLDYQINRARKALFKLIQCVSSERLRPKVLLNLFNHMILPIALYGSEVWGTSLITMQARNQNTLWKKFNKFKVEGIMMCMARFILGIHKKTSIVAIRGELGLFPIGLTITKFLLRYHVHISDQHKDSILYNALLCNKKSKAEWTLRIDKVSRLFEFAIPKSKSEVSNIINKLRRLYEDSWTLELIRPSNNKLRTYNQYKSRLQYEHYLDQIPNPDHRKTLTRLRVSSHNLRIETGRWHKITPVQRTCKFCANSLIEDEAHFLLHCSLYSDLRINLISSVRAICRNYDDIPSDVSKLIFLMNSEGLVVNAVAQYCYVAFKRRAEHILFTNCDSGSLGHNVVTTRSGRTVKPPERLDI